MKALAKVWLFALTILALSSPVYAQQEILKGSASYTLTFLMQDTTTKAGKTGLSPTVRISKNGATSVTPTGAVQEVDSSNMPGIYRVVGNAADTDTDGTITLYATGTGADPFWDIVGVVVESNPRDSVRLGLTALPNAAAGASGGGIINGSNTGTVTISDGLVINRSTTNGTAIVATGNGTGSGVKAISGSGATGNGLEATAASTNGNGMIGTGTGTGADIKGSALEQLMSKAVASSLCGTVADNSVVGYLLAASTCSSYARSTDSLHASYANAPTIAEILTAFWQDLVSSSDFSTSGSIGKRLKDNIDAAISSVSGGTTATIVKGTAFNNFRVWMLTAAGGAVTGLSTGAITCKVAKDGGAFANLADTSELELGLGAYVVDLSSSETNANIISIVCTATGAQTYRADITPQH